MYPKALFEDLFPGSIMSQYYGVNLAFSNGEVIIFIVFIYVNILEFFQTNIYSII